MKIRVRARIREKNRGKGIELGKKRSVHKLRGETTDFFSPTNN